MTVVKMFIDKFNGEVLIDDEHPLAIAQMAKPKKSKVAAPVVEDEDEDEVEEEDDEAEDDVTVESKPRRKKTRRAR